MAVRDQLAVVHDGPTPCPYLDGLTARMPLHAPLVALTLEDTDSLLAGGFRRSGAVVYYTRCAACQACEPTRVDVQAFQLTRSQRRVLRRAQRDLTLTWQLPRVDSARVLLYNRHRSQRGLGASDHPVDAADYHAFLTSTCFNTLELEMRMGERLIGISIMDVGQESVSAVYTHFDPEAARYSPGTLAVLHQILWARRTFRRWVYLGLYVASNPHLNYKAKFQPQQRRIDGKWRDVDPADRAEEAG